MRDEFKNSHLWHSRGFLPHYDASNKFQMITYRLADSLPQKIQSNETLSAKEKLARRIEIDMALDEGYGSCLLENPLVAKIVVDAWKFFDNKRYDLIAYVVMPNHVHLLAKTYDEFLLSSIVHSWKSYTAHEIKKLLGSRGSGETPELPEYSENGIWQIEYWDRFIRDEKHYCQAINYIHDNPVKAGLCNNPEAWPWSSYHSGSSGVSPE